MRNRPCSARRTTRTDRGCPLAPSWRRVTLSAPGSTSRTRRYYEVISLFKLGCIREGKHRLRGGEGCLTGGQFTNMSLEIIRDAARIVRVSAREASLSRSTCDSADARFTADEIERVAIDLFTASGFGARHRGRDRRSRRHLLHRGRFSATSRPRHMWCWPTSAGSATVSFVHWPARPAERRARHRVASGVPCDGADAHRGPGTNGPPGTSAVERPRGHRRRRRLRR